MYNTLIKAVIALALLGVSHYSMYTLGKRNALEDVKVAEAVYKQKLNSAQDRHEEAIEHLERKKNEEIASVNASLDDALRRLQQRPSRPQVITEVREIREACTGRELFKEDGEFLAREAARADKILAERNYYFERYEQARIMLERIRNE